MATRFSIYHFIFIAAVFTMSAAQNASATTAAPGSANWKILKTSWAPTDENNYSSFINALGKSGCNSINGCLKNSANPYRASDNINMSLGGDCGKFAYLLRGYFAWKNNLPFSWVDHIDSADGAGADLRYSPHGNAVLSRHDVTQSSASNAISGMGELRDLVGTVFTGMFRFSPDREDLGGAKFFDFASVKIDRAGVRPGTMIYDPNGHVAIVYEVETDGRALYMDAHPDDSVSHGTYGEKFVRASPGMGAGFKDFRPLVLVGATRASDGSYVGGHIETIPDAQVPDFSKEQYFGTESNPSENWRTAQFVINGQVLNYYDFVRTRLAVGELKYHPIDELTNGIDALCNDIKDRVTAVDNALASGIQNHGEPENLPMNIYGSDGDWETYSSPSRDARLKTSFREIFTNTQNYVELYKAGSPRVVYTGSNIGSDLRAAYTKETQACSVEYTKSNQQKVALSYNDISARLFAISFDPYHCPERRWGASGSELSSCPDGSEKQEWYAAEQYLRNQLDRTYDIQMGFSLGQLQSHVPGSGVAAAPNVDLKDYLNSL